MKIVSELISKVVYKTYYLFPDELWEQFKDTIRDEHDIEDDEEIRYEFNYDFMCWLEEQLASGDNRITTEESEEMINGDYKYVKWDNE